MTYVIRRSDGSFHLVDQGYLFLSEDYADRLKEGQTGWTARDAAEGFLDVLRRLGVADDGWTIEEVE